MRTDVAVEKLVMVAPTLINTIKKFREDEELKSAINVLKENGTYTNIDVVANLLPIFLSKYREQLFLFVAVFTNKSVEDVKAQSIVKTIMDIKELAQDEDIANFTQSLVNS